MKLKPDKTYIYYDFPIIFSALDEGGNTFICLFAEETDSHLRYLCVPVSKTILMELEYNQQDIRSIFIHPKKVFNLLLNANSEEPIEVVETSEDITPFLPEKDLFITEILDEIDAMTSQEHRPLFNEAQRLRDFLTDWESISIPIAPGGEIFSSNISFSIDCNGPFEPLQSNYYFEGDIICLQAA